MLAASRPGDRRAWRSATGPRSPRPVDSSTTRPPAPHRAGRHGSPAVRLHLHLISDSTGETVTTVARAAVSQFEDLVSVEHVWFFVRSKPQLDKVLTIVEALPGLVVFTLVSPELRHMLQERCRMLGVPCVAVLDPVMAALTNLIGSGGSPRIRRHHAPDEESLPQI